MPNPFVTQDPAPVNARKIFGDRLKRSVASVAAAGEKGQGERNNELYRAAARLAPYVDQPGGDRELARQFLADAARKAGLDEAEINPTINSGFNRKNAPPPHTPDYPPEPGEKLVLPNAAKSAANLARCLAHVGKQVRLNTRSLAVEVADLGERSPFGWSTFDDNEQAHVRELIRELVVAAQKTKQTEMAWSETNAWWSALRALAFRNQVDPFARYLQDLPDWDDTPRIAGVLHQLFGADPACPVARWASEYIWRGPTCRTRRPGQKLDVMPILIGPQGIGKSPVLSGALPPDGKEQLFTDDYDFRADAKGAFETVAGCAIVEAGELKGLGGANLESTKAALSRSHFRLRPAYGRVTITHPRSDVVIGTTNAPHCVPSDPTGSRRFAPVLLQHGSNVEAFLDDHREQLWAEAQSYEAAPELAREHYHVRDALGEHHRNSDDSGEHVAALLLDDNEVRRHAEDGGSFSLTWLNNRCQFAGRDDRDGNWIADAPMRRADANRLADALEAVGFVRHQLKSRAPDPGEQVGRSNRRERRWSAPVEQA